MTEKGTWKCTDIGRTNITAIKINSSYNPEWYNVAWYKRPKFPRGVEVVFTPDELSECVPVLKPWSEYNFMEKVYLFLEKLGI